MEHGSDRRSRATTGYVAMRTVHLLETFEDVEHACRGSRSGGDDDVPMMADTAVLHITGERMELESEQFTLSEELRLRGKEFVEWCIHRVVGRRGCTDKLFR